MPVIYDPQYILRLDELPKVVEADGTVYPVFMSLRDAARMFGSTTSALMAWHRNYGFPIVRVGDPDRGRIFIEVAALNDWITEHSVPRRRPE